MQNIINQAHSLLLKTGKKVSVAESCTGGLLSYLLTQLSGSSKYFILGVVAYSNRSKEKVLGIPASLIAKKGAVSRPVACLMAKKIKRIAKTDLGIGVTGIAGPTGATAGKPVGTVFIAISGKKISTCKKFHFKGNRSVVRKKAAQEALRLLKTALTS